VALDHRQAADRWRSKLDRVEHGLLTAAANARFHRKRDEPIVIADLGEPRATKLRGGVWIDRDGEPVGRTALRSAASLDDEGRPYGVLRMRPCAIVKVR